MCAICLSWLVFWYSETAYDFAKVQIMPLVYDRVSNDINEDILNEYNNTVENLTAIKNDDVKENLAIEYSITSVLPPIVKNHAGRNTVIEEVRDTALNVNLINTNTDYKVGIVQKRNTASHPSEQDMVENAVIEIDATNHASQHDITTNQQTQLFISSAQADWYGSHKPVYCFA